MNLMFATLFGNHMMISAACSLRTGLLEPAIQTLVQCCAMQCDKSMLEMEPY